jgi:hypothetical protein
MVSWLNIAETLFGKMARTFLRHIRVQSRDQHKHPVNPTIPDRGGGA